MLLNKEFDLSSKLLGVGIALVFVILWNFLPEEKVVPYEDAGVRTLSKEEYQQALKDEVVNLKEWAAFNKGVNQGRIEIFTGQVICRQIPLQGTQIQLECKTRKEIEDLLRFIQPKSVIK